MKISMIFWVKKYTISLTTNQPQSKKNYWKKHNKKYKKNPRNLKKKSPKSKNNKKLTVSQKLSKIKVILWENRYPVLYSKDKEIKKKLNALKFPKNMKVSIPAFLEGNTVNISISIKKISELKKAEAVFKNLIQDENLNEILEYL